MHILVINCGSSSIKFRLYDTQETLLLAGEISRIGEAEATTRMRHYHVPTEVKEQTTTSAVADHAAAMQQIVAFLENSGVLTPWQSLTAIGHRVVHGGERFQAPTLIDDDVVEGIRAMTPLAPLHNPVNLLGIEAMRRLCPHVPQVAVFDTAYFSTLSAHAYRYALPEELYRHHQVRRYGFHGTSHQHVAQRAAEVLQQPLDKLRLITLHLGNGASAAAIRNGICIDTSMGMSPLEGLIMGTRCGDLDPAIPFYLARVLNMDCNKVEALLHHNSGLKGLCGTQDMRDVHQMADEGNEQARLAIEMFCYRIAKYIGAYYVALGGLDALVFSAGIGEHDPLIREKICSQLGALGIVINQQHNRSNSSDGFAIHAQNDRCKVLVIPTNEELEIARETLSIINLRKL